MLTLAESVDTQRGPKRTRYVFVIDRNLYNSYPDPLERLASSVLIQVRCFMMAACRKSTQPALGSLLHSPSIALDVLQLKHSIDNVHLLLGSLFRLLNQLTDSSHVASQQPTTTYTIQLVLATLCTITDSFVAVDTTAANPDDQRTKRRKVTASVATNKAALLPTIKPTYDVQAIVRCVKGRSTNHHCRGIRALPRHQRPPKQLLIGCLIWL
jgi:hypothetical protein